MRSDGSRLLGMVLRTNRLCDGDVLGRGEGGDGERLDGGFSMASRGCGCNYCGRLRYSELRYRINRVLS